MDRNKSIPTARGSKGKITQQPPDQLIALGAKQSSPRDDPKRSVPLPKTTVSSHLQPSTSTKDKLKREASSTSLTAVPPSKKMKVSIPGGRTGLPGSSTANLLGVERLGAGSQSNVEPWEAFALDCESSELFENIMFNIENGNTEKGIAYILGVIRSLKSQRSKLCKVVYSALCLACSCKPSIFTNENVVNAMLSVLRRDVTAGLKGANKSNMYVHMLFINLTTRAFEDIPNWPETFLKIYIEDAMGERIFIDNPYSKPFVDNVITAFGTKMPPSSLLKSETWSSANRDTSSPLTINSIDDDEVLNEHKSVVDTWGTKTFPRYTQAQETVEKIVLEAIKDQLARRQQPETITKNFVRFLSSACGLVEIRVIAVSRIETWLHNHKLMKSAQELLAYLCYNCSANSQRDVEVIAQLSKLRLKNKPMVNYFNNCLREMVFSFPENLFPLMKYTIYNELSNARNTNNLIMVGALFQVAPEPSASAFADICFELLLNKDDYLRSLRTLLKEINRVLRHDFNLLNVAHHLLRERKEFLPAIKEHEFKDRIFFSLADLACVCMLLCVSPQVRDAATQSKRDVTVLKQFQSQVSNIQRECVTWLHDSALRIYRPNLNDFHHVLLKVLFLEQAEHYYKVDNWPGENERNLFLRLTSEVPLLQTTLLRILLIGLSKEHPIGQTEIIDITDQLIKRAANLPADCAPPLVVDKTEILDFFFNLCSYNYPENITLPVGYVPPKLAISGLYWKVWLILLILAAHNPANLGSLAWDKYPILRMFMEMCITNHFSYPPPTMANIEEDQAKEQQMYALEKQKILEFESHLAAASTKVEINEQTSLLLPQLMELYPFGEARRPPPQILEQLQILNKTHRMGHLLCRSRNPDFLLDIMSRQGGTAHMPWLAELVHNSEGVLAHLPVQCLCEYLLSTAPTEKLTKHGQLLAHLRTVVNGNDAQIAFEVLEYLFRRLTSDHGASRTQATKGLCLILAPSEEEPSENQMVWLTNFIKQFPHFAVIKPILVQFLRQALQIETNPTRVSAYINFLSTQDLSESIIELNELISDLSSVIIERHSVASYVLPGDNNTTLKNLLTVFYLHSQKIRHYPEETLTFIENYGGEFVYVSLTTGEQSVPMLCGVIHAAIILLTYGPLDDFEPFNLLLNTWFPLNGDYPRAVLPNSAESTSYLPDWMKLRMIRSNVARLVDAALEKLEPQKLVLFIQSFGIPTNSISKLLHYLDKATMVDAKLVMDSVLDKTYMIQLVEVQNKRGAKGGEIFVKAIEMQVSPVVEKEIKIPIEMKKPLPLARQQLTQKLSNVNEQDVLEILNNLFSPYFEGDRNQLILYLIKNISLKKSVINWIENHLKSILYYSPDIVATVMEYNAFSSLLRLIFNQTEANKLAIAHKLLDLIRNKNHSSAIVLRQYIKTHEKAIKMEIDQEEERKEAKKEFKIANHSDLDERLGKLLLEKESAEQTGLLVDWLSEIELEIANSDKHKLQMNLLFSKHTLQFRPLLMSLVLQRAGWKTLYGIISYLLREDISDICPVSALDFVNALNQNQRLWQGRDKAVPKHYHSEVIFRLSKKQIMQLVSYILEEAKIPQDDWKKKMETRLDFLLKCLGNAALAVTKFLSNSADTDIYSRELLLLIYMALPFSIQTDTNLSNMSKDIYDKNYSSSVDKIAHCLLSALAATPRSKDWTRKSQDYELCSRKLAATHPMLVLRQLPMLAGSLKGRAQYEWGVLKSRGHLMLFGQVLGIVELLQPFVFEQKETLVDLIDSYYLLMQYHGTSKDLSVIVNRIVTFMQNWMVRDLKTVSKYLQEHGSVLNDIQLSQPGVRPLLSSVSLPSRDPNKPSELLVGAVNPPIAEILPQHWFQLLTALQSPENLHALQELDHLTSKRPQLLQSVSQHLYTALSSPNGAIRSLALSLIIRWLKFSPVASREALPSVLACLDSNNGDIVASVLDRLCDLVTVMQEYAKVILTRVFLLGMKSTLNTTSNITKSVNLLNLQFGC